MEIVVAKNILSANEQIAEENAALLRANRVFTINLVGSPGGGKTTLLEGLLGKMPLESAVIQGDLATSLDAERIEAMGIQAIQINTGQGCHLDARMVSQALARMDLEPLDFLVIENVGNLVCTAGFALGESVRGVVLSVTEGDDKIAKYPPIFASADVIFINKIDLLAYTNFNMEKAVGQLRQINPDARILTVSARTGEGIEECARWLNARREEWLKTGNCQ